MGRCAAPPIQASDAVLATSSALPSCLGCVLLSDIWALAAIWMGSPQIESCGCCCCCCCCCGTTELVREWREAWTPASVQKQKHKDLWAWSLRRRSHGQQWLAAVKLQNSSQLAHQQFCFPLVHNTLRAWIKAGKHVDQAKKSTLAVKACCVNNSTDLCLLRCAAAAAAAVVVVAVAGPHPTDA